MRRAHRRSHLVFWVLVAAATLTALAIALEARPDHPLTELPGAIAEDSP